MRGYQMAGQMSGDIIDQLLSGDPNEVNMGSGIGSGALRGAGMGASIGSIIPGLGTAVGAGVGALGGAAMGYFGGQQQQDQIAQQQKKEQYVRALQQFGSNRRGNAQASLQYNPVFQDGGKLNSTNPPLPVDNVGSPDLVIPDWMQTRYSDYSGPTEWKNPRTLAVPAIQPYLDREMGISRDVFKKRLKSFNKRHGDKGFEEFLKTIEKRRPDKFRMSKTGNDEPTLDVNMPLPGVGSEERNEYGNRSLSPRNFRYGGKKEMQDGGMLNEFNGPSHEGGGIDIGVAEVEGGETEFDMEDYIFSDVLKNPNTKNTFAQDSKKINDKYGKREDTDPLTYKAKKRELGRLMQAQEEIRKKDEEKTMAKGGYKKQEGGYMGFQEGLDVGDFMQYAPLIASAGQTLGNVFSDVEYAETPRMQNRFSSPQIDPRPYLQDVEEQFGQTEAAITRGARTPGQYMSGRIQSATEESKARGDVMRNVAEMNRQAQEKANYWDYLVQKQNREADYRNQRSKLQAEAQRRGLISQGLANVGTQAGQIAGDVRRTQAQGRFNQRYLDLLDSMYGDLYYDEGWQTRPQEIDPASMLGEIPMYSEDVPMNENQRNQPLDPFMRYNEAGIDYSGESLFNLP